jgi:hypothetical protein
MGNQPWWSFTMFNDDMYKYRQRWERDNPILKIELMAITHNYDPLHGYRHLTRNATNFGSKNAWYTYMRTIKYFGQDNFFSWTLEVHPTAENTDKPFHKPHHIFEIMMPEEFLDGEKFMALNVEPKGDSEEKKSFLVGANIRS